MNQNLNTSTNSDNEIDLTKILKLLIDSKKLIIVTTIFTSLFALLLITLQKPIYTSTALIEVGGYQSSSFETKIIEPLSELMDDIEINYILKRKLANLKLRPIASRLLEIKYTSPLIENNNELLNELVKYIEIKHSKILINDFKKDEDQLINEIEILNAQIEFANSQSLTKRSEEKLNLSNQIKRLNAQEKLLISNKIASIDSELPNLIQKINLIKKIIIEDENNLKLLSSNPDLLIKRASESPTLNQIIYIYNDELINLKARVDSLSIEKAQLQDQLNAIEAEIANLANGNLETEKIFYFSEEKAQLQDQLNALANGNLESEKIFNLNRKKENLKSDLASLKNLNITKTKLAREIETRAGDSKKINFLILGFISGLVLSIMILLLNNAFKEEHI